MTLIVATLCPEGIALAADSKCMVSRHWTNPETGEHCQEISGFVTNGQKLVLTDNNVGIALQGNMTMKGRPATLFLDDHFKKLSGLNARQVAEEMGRLYREDASITESEVLVAGYMPGRGCMFQDLSLQDAIDLSVLSIEMTYRTMRFQDREQTVGPPIDVLVITGDGGQWFQKKELRV